MSQSQLTSLLCKYQSLKAKCLKNSTSKNVAELLAVKSQLQGAI